ncbi:hypothetical protein D3C73_733040 [compost metagenome]
MYAYRVEVFHITYHDTVIVGITHNLIFDFLHTGDASFNQALSDWAVTNTRSYCFFKLFFCVADTAASSTKCISRANDDWEADFFGKLHRFWNRCYNDTIWYRLLKFSHQVSEKIAIFCFLNSRQLSAQQFHILALKHACSCKLNSHVQSSLSTKCRQQTIRTLLTNNLRNKLKCNRFDIYFISHVRIGHNRGWVTVDQNNFHAFFFQSLARLCSSVVELRSLTDNDRA